MSGTYRKGILSDPLELDDPTLARVRFPKVAATRGLGVILDGGGEATVVECTDAVVSLRDGNGRNLRVRNVAGAFRVDGRRVALVTPAPVAIEESRVTASGSIAGDAVPARVARASRIYVEGIHDAELLERVWGDDLRSEGVVVQPMDGIDDLAQLVRGFGPRPGRRLGVLVDHLVVGTKESRLAAAVDHPDVLVRGHRFVDVWAAISPKLVGLDVWPDVPRDRVWKDGICEAVGATDPRRFWRELLGRVRDYRDLDPSLVGAVEELIDFVTADRP
ncbi:MAG TPA: DUF3097 family protein [Microthrixaceae bacterium]|nr:DUF3097 family protein [Microthrixaceae bacterium]